MYKKVGILGGTFNPIHIGHLMIGEQAYSVCDLDTVLVMPSAKPPHKSDSNILDEKHRSKMVKLAISGNKHFEYSDFELTREGYIYTSDTLEILTNSHPDTKYYFILGEDSLMDIEKWYKPDTVLKLCTIAVIHRNNEQTDDELDNQIKYLQTKYNAVIIKLDMPRIDISSTDIRNRVQAHRTIKYMVPSDVENYIYQNDLYREG